MNFIIKKERNKPIELRTWFNTRIKLPILALFIFLICAQFIYFYDLNRKSNQNKKELIENTSVAISLAINQNNRQLLETLLELVLRQADADSISICDGQNTLINYPTSIDNCNLKTNNSSGFLKTEFSINKKIYNDTSIEISVKGKNNNLFYFYTFYAFISFVLMTASLLLLAQIKKRVKNEIIDCLTEFSNETEPSKIKEIEEIKIKQKELNKIKTDQAIKDAMFYTCTQVAHDIKSPLAALENVLLFDEKNEKIEDRLLLIKSAIYRIHEIAKNLLTQNSINSAESIKKNENSVNTEITKEVKEIIREKEIQFIHTKKLNIEFINLDESNKISMLHPSTFKRVISNLLNNSIEATNHDGNIKIIIKNDGNNNEITISDDGKGIPDNIINSLFKRGSTFNKISGSGLGLFHAKECIENWGGTINIYSKINIGTEVVIKLPSVLDVINQNDSKTLISEKTNILSNYILIDDDDLVHMSWGFAAKEDGINIDQFKNPDDFISKSDSFSRNVNVYIDHQLGNNKNGLDYAKSIHDLGFKNIWLCTGLPSEKFENIDFLKGCISKSAPWRS